MPLPKGVPWVDRVAESAVADVGGRLRGRGVRALGEGDLRVEGPRRREVDHADHVVARGRVREHELLGGRAAVGRARDHLAVAQQVEVPVVGRVGPVDAHVDGGVAVLRADREGMVVVAAGQEDAEPGLIARRRARWRRRRSRRRPWSSGPSARRCRPVRRSVSTADSWLSGSSPDAAAAASPGCSRVPRSKTAAQLLDVVPGPAVVSTTLRPPVTRCFASFSSISNGVENSARGQRRRDVGPRLAAVLGHADVAADVLLVGDLRVVGIDGGEEAVAAVDRVHGAVRIDLDLAVVLQAHVDRAVLGHRRVVGQQRGEAVVGAAAALGLVLAPLVVGEVLTRRRCAACRRRRRCRRTASRRRPRRRAPRAPRAGRGGWCRRAPARPARPGTRAARWWR